MVNHGIRQLKETHYTSCVISAPADTLVLFESGSFFPFVAVVLSVFDRPFALSVALCKLSSDRAACSLYVALRKEKKTKEVEEEKEQGLSGGD